MTKSTVLLGTALLLSGATAFGQMDNAAPAAEKEHSFKSKNGHEVLPQKKDWALGLSATGFLNYIGNLMNGNTSNNGPAINNANGPWAFGIGNINGLALSGKYMRNATLAYRIRFQANAGRTSYRNMVAKDVATPDPLNPQFVEDKMDIDAHAILLSAGFEKRRGAGRLQGFYGAEAMVGFAGNKRTFTYGNGFSSAFPLPSSTSDFISGTAGPATSRTAETASGNSILGGVRGFGGVEYFFAPKISLGGEIGYSLGMSTNGKGSTTTETWNSGTSQKSTIITKDYGNSGLSTLGAGLDNINAGINLHFYF